MIVTVGPLLSQRLWKVLAAQPSTDARQQRIHREDLLWATGLSQFLKNFKLFPKMLECFSSPRKKKTTATKKQEQVNLVFPLF